MKTLILDTSTNLLLVGMVEDKKILFEVETKGLNNHSDHLLPHIEEGLKKLNLEVKDFDRIILGVGPGAYTGLRVSMAVAKMFSWTLNIPLYTISSLDLLTTGYKEDGKYTTAFKAKKGYIYNKTFEIKDNKKINVSKEKFAEISEVEGTDSIVLTHDEIKIDLLNIKEDELTLVDNVHALEPNYLRDF